MPPKSTPEILAFRRRLMRWFRRTGRDLPWRRTRDPYAVLVSEVMLQQTQVVRVTEYYSRFLARFPSLEALALARPAEVRRSWAGLGYYRRAANLHRMARLVVREHAGQVPLDPSVLVTLPGIGRYTAGAVASFAYEQRVAAVDTNVGRVIRRAFLTPPGAWPARARPGAASTEQETWALAERLVPRAGNAAWTFNQAIMELGALVCTARVARCEICPVRPVCQTGRRLPPIPGPDRSPRPPFAAPAPARRAR